MGNPGKPAVNIEGTKFGEITINGRPYDADMTVWWNGKLSYRSKEHTIEMGEFINILKTKAEVVVIGTGQSGGVTITPEVIQWAERKGVDLYKDLTPRAVKLFNAFISKGKKVVGIFHVTC